MDTTQTLLRSLRTFTFIGSPADLVALLRHTHSLVHLRVVTDTDLDPLLIGLTATNELNPLIPELKQLTIELDRRTITLPRWTTLDNDHFKDEKY